MPRQSANGPRPKKWLAKESQGCTVVVRVFCRAVLGCLWFYVFEPLWYSNWRLSDWDVPEMNTIRCIKSYLANMNKVSFLAIEERYKPWVLSFMLCLQKCIKMFDSSPICVRTISNSRRWIRLMERWPTHKTSGNRLFSFLFLFSIVRFVEYKLHNKVRPRISQPSKSQSSKGTFWPFGGQLQI